jgi:hypothetical protein
MQLGLSLLLGPVGGIVTTPGSKSGVEVSTITTSRVFLPAINVGAVVSVIGTDGVELWVDPLEDTIDVNNFSTYDPVTKIGRIVSDGTNVDLVITSALTVSAEYFFEYVELSRTGGTVQISSFGTYNLTVGSESGILEATSTSLTVKRTGTACDVSFRLSVQELDALATKQVNESGGFDAIDNTQVDGDTYELRLTSSASNSTAAYAVLLADDVVTSTFTVTTKAAAFAAVNPDDSEMLNPDASSAVNPT